MAIAGPEALIGEVRFRISARSSRIHSNYLAYKGERGQVAVATDIGARMAATPISSDRLPPPKFHARRRLSARRPSHRNGSPWEHPI